MRPVLSLAAAAATALAPGAALAHGDHAVATTAHMAGHVLDAVLSSPTAYALVLIVYGMHRLLRTQRARSRYRRK